jgi:hypothetical protein
VLIFSYVLFLLCFGWLLFCLLYGFVMSYRYLLYMLFVVYCYCKHESVYLAPIRFPKYSRQRRRPTSRGTTLQQKKKCGKVTTTFETDFHKIVLDLTRQLLLLDTLFPLINNKVFNSKELTFSYPYRPTEQRAPSSSLSWKGQIQLYSCKDDIAKRCLKMSRTNLGSLCTTKIKYIFLVLLEYFFNASETDLLQHVIN